MVGSDLVLVTDVADDDSEVRKYLRSCVGISRSDVPIDEMLLL